jgi:hypothetical protein
MNRISRKVTTLGAAGLLALAGIGGVVGTTAIHASGPPAATQPASDKDAVQQEVQSGNQQDLGGVDKPEAGAPTAPDTDSIQSQNQLDTP